MKSLYFKIFVFLFISLCLLLTTHYSFAQRGSSCPEDLVPKLGDNRMWGYTNLMGHWVINPSYTKVSPYVESKAVVMKGLKYGVIDCEGNPILHADYEKLTNFKYGKIWAMKNGLWGMLNEKGGIVLDHQFSQINPIAYTELAWVKKGELWGLVNEEKGTFICRPQYKIAQIMSENATLVQKEEPTFGVINHVSCEYLLPHTITKVKKVAAHTIIYQVNGKWGVFNEWGKVVANADYDSIAAIPTAYDTYQKNYDLILVFKKNNLFGLMTLGGKEVINAQFEEISEYSNGYLRVKQNGKYGYANRMGKVYIKPGYEEGTLFYDNRAIVKKDGKYGVIDIKNSFVIPASYVKIERNPASKFFAVTARENSGVEKVYLYGLNGKKISEEAFESVTISDSSAFVRVKKDGKVKFFNTLTSLYSLEGSFDQANGLYQGFILAALNGKWGVIDPKGKQVIPFEYEKIEYDWFNSAMVFRIFQNQKMGIADHAGKVMLPCEYELIVPSLPIYLKAKKNGKYGVMKNTGVQVIPFEYDFISNEKESPGVQEWPAIIVKKEKFGLINEKGEEIYPAKAVKIEYLGEGFYSVKEKKLFGLMNSKASNEYHGKYDAIREFGNGLAAFQKGGKWGYLNKKDEEQIKAQFDDAGLFINYMAPVQIGGLWGVIDVTGRLMVKAEYDKYVTLEDGTRKFYKGGKEFTLFKGGVLK